MNDSRLNRFENIEIELFLAKVERFASMNLHFLDLIMLLYPIESILRNLDRKELGKIQFYPAWMADIHMDEFFKEDL